MVKIESAERINTQAKENISFKKGLIAGAPIAIGYIPIAIAFGLLARTNGVPTYTSFLMSFLIFAGASQFVGINLLAIGASYSEIILTTFILNFRHFLMSSSMSQRLENSISKRILALLSFGITDETFMVASMRSEEKLSSRFVLGLNLIAFSSWNVGTWIGVFLGAGLPESIQSSMGIALYAMFIGLLIPSIKKSGVYLSVSILSITISSIIYWMPAFDFISEGWSIVLTTILAALIGAILFPKGGDRQ